MTTEWAGVRSWSMQRDSEGHRTYKLITLVRADYNDGPNLVLNTAGLPAVGSFWVVGNDSDAWAWCRPDATVKIHQEKEGDPSRWWTVEQTFSTKPLDPNKNRCGDTQIEDPLLEPPKVSGTFKSRTEEATHDRYGNLLKNSAHEPFKGKDVEFDRSYPQVKIEQNVASLEIGLFSAMIDSVNASPLWGLLPRRVKLSNVSWERKYYGQCYVYYTRTMEFDIRYEGFDRTMPDAGTKVLNGHWDNTAGTDSGESLWVLDDINGGPPDPDNPQHFIRYKDRNGENSRVVLNGRGEPAATLTTNSITGAHYDAGLGRITFFVTSPVTVATGDIATVEGVNPPMFDGKWLVAAPETSSTEFDVAAPDDFFGSYVEGGSLLLEGDQADGPGIIHIEKYPEADLLLLGIPTSF